MGNSLKSGAVAVKIRRELYDGIKDWALLNNKSVQQVVNEGLDFWYDIEAKTTMDHNFEKMATSIAQHAEEPCFVTPEKTYPCKHPS